jgi:hypothetical protein
MNMEKASGAKVESLSQNVPTAEKCERLFSPPATICSTIIETVACRAVSRQRLQTNRFPRQQWRYCWKLCFLRWSVARSYKKDN